MWRGIRLQDSEYADDTGIPFDSREDLETETPILINHFRRFGMEIHLGNRTTEKDSKSEILFVAKPQILYENLDTYDDAYLSDLDLENVYPNCGPFRLAAWLVDIARTREM